MWGILSDEREDLPFTVVPGIIHESESGRNHDHTLLSQIEESPNLEGNVPVCISPRNREAQLYPQALGSLFVATYDSQGYSGCILTRQNTVLTATKSEIFYYGWYTANQPRSLRFTISFFN
jgi:hypothetical protein